MRMVHPLGKRYKLCCVVFNVVLVGIAASDEASAALGGKESKAYANSLMGSILGMPLSEIGPCINILIKLFAVQALLLAVFFHDHTEVGLIFEIWHG
jgi:hypothetical protein